MAVNIIRKASKTTATVEHNTAKTVQAMLVCIEQGGELKKGYADKLDGWEGNIVIAKVAAEKLISEQAKQDINALINQGNSDR